MLQLTDIPTLPTDPSIDYLRDQLDWMRAALELRTASADSDVASTIATIAVVRARIAERVTQVPELPASWLASRLGLSETEQQVLWLLVAVDLDPDVRRVLGDSTLDAIRKVVYGTQLSRRAFDELGPEAPLRRLALIERSDGGAPDLHASRQTFAIARRVVALAHGDVGLDAELRTVATFAPPCLSIAQLALESSVVKQLKATVISGASTIVMASGPPGTGRRSALVAAAIESGHIVLQVDGRSLASDPNALSHQLRRIARDCRLLGCVPLILGVDTMSVDQLASLAHMLVPEISGLILLTSGSQSPALRWSRPMVTIRLAGPSGAQRAELWDRALGGIVREDAEHLATHYPLSPALIDAAGRATLARSGGQPLTPEDIRAGICAVLDDRLGTLARRVEVTQTWDDLVLSTEQTDPVIELMARVRERQRVYEDWGFGRKVGKGLGVTALFSGPPGTGKTMLAAVMARALGLELYQVDLARIVSKWIGETEKQLAELFDAAEAGHAILLFDEADSLFGKRTEVKSSNDRHANLETNYLLQRLESFTGVSILTSNHEANIDPAFQRRLSLHLQFELPDADERVKLWRAMLPAAAPAANELDLERLAERFEMSGGYIRNAAVRAAFMAADEGTEITAAHLARAAELEYVGMGKIVALG